MTLSPDPAYMLRSLEEFSSFPFATSPCPAVLLAISQAEPEEILAASRHAIRQVRGELDVADISDMSLAEMDYAFTNLEFFLSRVGNYGPDGPTLRDWAAKPRNAAIFYAIEASPPAAPQSSLNAAPAETAPIHAVAVLANQLVCSRNPHPVKIVDADVADWRIGQVFAINRMSDTRWSA